MTLEVRNSSGVAELVQVIEIRDASDVAVPVKIVQVRDASGTARTVWQAMSASAAPSIVNGYGNSSVSVDIDTDIATVSVVGGVAPYTYAWSSASGWTVLSPSSASTQFRGLTVAPSTSKQDDFTCLVTDANGLTATTNAVTASVININES